MKLVTTVFATTMLLASSISFAADTADVEAVVAAVKKANPDFRALCQQGGDGIRKAVTEAATALATTGKLAGDPQSAGKDAGQRIGKECRGG